MLYAERRKAVAAIWKVIHCFTDVAPADRRPTNALYATELYVDGKTTLDDMERSGVDAYKAAETVSGLAHHAALACYLVTSHKIENVQEALRTAKLVAQIDRERKRIERGYDDVRSLRVRLNAANKEIQRLRRLIKKEQNRDDYCPC